MGSPVCNLGFRFKKKLTDYECLNPYTTGSPVCNLSFRLKKNNKRHYGNLSQHVLASFTKITLKS